LMSAAVGKIQLKYFLVGAIAKTHLLALDLTL
jgi:hypothetical protein